MLLYGKIISFKSRVPCWTRESFVLDVDTFTLISYCGVSSGVMRVWWMMLEHQVVLAILYVSIDRFSVSMSRLPESTFAFFGLLYMHWYVLTCTFSCIILIFYTVPSRKCNGSVREHPDLIPVLMLACLMSWSAHFPQLRECFMSWGSKMLFLKFYLKCSDFKWMRGCIWYKV